MGQAIYTAAERAAMAAKPVAILKREDVDALAKIDAATSALSEVRDIWAAKKAMDYAAVLRQAVRAIDCHEQVERDAKALTIEARRTFGEYWRDAEKHTGGRPAETCSDTQQVFVPTLSDLDVDRRVAAEAVKLCTLADEYPDTYFALKSGEITKGKALATLKPPKEPEEFHILVDAARFKDSVRALIAKWPEAERAAIPELLRDIAREMEVA